MNRISHISLACALTAESTQAINDGIWVTFKLRLKHDCPVKLLPWQTPLEGILGDLFFIKDEKGSPISYKGPSLKRREPDITDFLEVDPDQPLINNFDLAPSYALERGKNYSITMKYSLINIIDENNRQHFVSCHTNQLELNIR
ncbi:hypothetical protein [Aliikangiella coralliicola]|uniref:Protease n=1 Tax=Aliikangiella coralliicola TaxID=2592383 RepID=A0A545UA56_9GAMM|nr:hypothetical protein [Aliikangiella coralliicola]TQV86355.1 hypothetical protein FLL46_15645 [Aliikangiella coralliicola]